MPSAALPTRDAAETDERASDDSVSPPSAALPSDDTFDRDAEVDAPEEVLAQEAIMSPEASPWRTQKSNRRPIIVIGALAVGVCGLMGYAALERYAAANSDDSLRAASTDEPALPRGVDSRRMADDIIGQPHIGLIPDARDVVVDAGLTEPPAVEPQSAVAPVSDDPPRPPPRAPDEAATAKPSKDDEEWRQARVAALREALIAPRTIRFDRQAREPAQGDFVQRELARVAQQRAALGGPTDPMAAYQQAAAQAAQLLAGAQPSAAQRLPMANGAMAAGVPFAGAAPSAGLPPSSNARNDLRAFAPQGGGEDRWRLPNRVEAAESPYMLLPGDIIPAVMDSAINSELPGPIMGHVASPVYSSTGNHELLAPPGTKIYGEYSADVVFGQNRLLVAWQLLRFPNDTTLDIGAMPGTDGLGRAGFEDQVDNHYFRLFGSALLLSLVTTGVTMAQNPGSSGADRMSVGGAMSQALGLQFGQVTAQLLQKNLNVAPTLEIRSGFRFNIVVTKKIPFPGPYRGDR